MRLFTVCDISSRDFYASDELRDELRERLDELPEADRVFVAFAYTDYGGDWLDVVATKYFEEEYGDITLVEKTVYFGKNCLVIGPIAREWIEETDSYLLGFRDFEEYFSNVEYEQFGKDMESFLDDLVRYEKYRIPDLDACMEWLYSEKQGQYGYTAQGVDFCSRYLTEDLLQAGMIERLVDD